MTQSWDPERYARSARFVSDLGAPLLDLLAPQPGERILDLGCGDGALTQKIAVTGATVVGVDASPRMVAAAQGRGLDARVMDGQALSFTSEFDAVFSNAALHWMRRADEVLVGVHRALRPGGRFVAEMGGQGNVAKLLAAIVRALEHRGVDGSSLEFRYYPGPTEYRGKLEAHGFVVDRIEHFPRPTPLAGGLNDWLENFGDAFFAPVSPSEHAALKREIAQEAAADLQRPDGSWFADYVRLRFKAYRSN